MANEATLMWETEIPIPFTVADGTGIEKGSLLKLTDPATAIIHSGDEDAIVGIAAEEKIASDGRTKIGVYMGGIFKMTTSAAVTVGTAVAASGTVNKVKAADATCVGSKIVGIALETSGGDAETILVKLCPGMANNNAYA
jgi:hypothetical protein